MRRGCLYRSYLFKIKDETTQIIHNINTHATRGCFIILHVGEPYNLFFLWWNTARYPLRAVFRYNRKIGETNVRRGRKRGAFFCLQAQYCACNLSSLLCKKCAKTQPALYRLLLRPCVYSFCSDFLINFKNFFAQLDLRIPPCIINNTCYVTSVT